MSKKKSLKKKAAATVDLTVPRIHRTLIDCLILLCKQSIDTGNILKRYHGRSETNPALMGALAELSANWQKTDRVIKTLQVLQEAIGKTYLPASGSELDPALED